MNITKFTKKLKEMDSQDIRLICGEMTAQEMRTSKAILKWVVSQFEPHIKMIRPPTTEQTIAAPWLYTADTPRTEEVIGNIMDEMPDYATAKDYGNALKQMIVFTKTLERELNMSSIDPNKLLKGIKESIENLNEKD